MKRIFIFALMTVSASSSFAISDLLKCYNGSVEVTTSHYANDGKNIHLTALFMVPNITFNSVVVSKSNIWKQAKAFTGTTTDGQQVKLIVRNTDPLSASLKVGNLSEVRNLTCHKQNFFEM